MHNKISCFVIKYEVSYLNIISRYYQNQWKNEKIIKNYWLASFEQLTILIEKFHWAWILIQDVIGSRCVKYWRSKDVLNIEVKDN